MRDSQRLKIGYGGVTFNETDFLCPDGDLAVCMGMENNSGSKVNALRHGPKSVMQMPSSEWTVLYVHHIVNTDICLLRRDWVVNNTECTTYHYIDVTDGYPSTLQIGADVKMIVEFNDGSYTIAGDTEVPYSTVKIVQVRHINRTLIARGEDGLLHYMLWKEGAYKYLGTKLPQLNVSFGLQAVMDRFYSGHEMWYTNIKGGEQPDFWSDDEELYDGISNSIIGSRYKNGQYNIADGKEQEVTETIMAKVNMLVSKCHENGWFCQPFLVRFALRLYDGSNAMQSPPLLMPVTMPGASNNMTLPWAVVDRQDFTRWHLDYIRAALDMAVEEASLNALKEWRDVVTGIDIAVSAPLYTYDPAGMCKYIYGCDANNDHTPKYVSMSEYRSPRSICKREHLWVNGSDINQNNDYWCRQSVTAANNAFYYSKPRMVQAGRINWPDNYSPNRLRGWLTYDSGIYGPFGLTEIPVGQYLIASYSAANEKPHLIAGDTELTPENAPEKGYILKEYSRYVVLYHKELKSANVPALTQIGWIEYDRHNGRSSDYGLVWITSDAEDYADEYGTTRQEDVNYTNQKKMYRFNEPFSVIALPEISKEDFKDKIQDCELFYKFCEIDLDDIKTERTVLQPKKNVLAYLTSQPIMVDEYHSHETLKADNIFAYNNRLNLSGVRSMLWDHFKASNLVAYQTGFNAPQNAVSVAMQLTLKIEDDTGNANVIKSQVENILSSGISTLPGTSLLQYLYYPRTNVKSAWLQIGEKYFEYRPDDHKGLNGSVYVGSMGTYLDNWKTLPGEGESPIPQETGTTMYYPSKLYTSDVNKPFVYQSENINTIGSGRILGMAVASKSISEGTEAGTYPMYCFTDTGVWLLQPNDHGGWQGKKAVMNDIVSDMDSILEIDSSVIIRTRRGILYISGEQSEVIIDTQHAMAPIQSTDLPGTTELFDSWEELQHLKSDGKYDNVMLDVAAFLRSDAMKMAYDYSNHRIVFWQKDSPVSVVFDLESKQLSTQPWDIEGKVISTGDCLCMLADTDRSGDTTWHLADLSDMMHKVKQGSTPVSLDIPDIGIMVTRPIKGTELGMRDLRKQLDSIWHQGRYSKTGLNIVVWGTEDYKHWHLVGQAAESSGLYNHHGAHWMAFVLALIAPGLPLADHIDSADLMFRPRLTGKSPAIVGY